MSFRSAVAGALAQTGLDDISGECRTFRLEGPDVLAWLATKGIECPETMFAVSYTGEDRETVVARVARDAIILQGGVQSREIACLENDLRARAPGVFLGEIQASTFRLSGPKAAVVWSQTCGVALPERPSHEVVYTRVAGVSVAVIPEQGEADRSYRIWVDYSYAPDLWNTFVEILSPG